MRTLRNAAAFLCVLVLVMIVYPMAAVAVGSAFVSGHEFQTYFGWFSWPPVIFASAPFLVFLIAGALLSQLVVSRHTIWWALLLGLAYGAIRVYFSSQSITNAREPIQILWAGLELVIPVLAACLGAYLLSRHTTRRSTDAKAA
jgi:hypothetical protein